jgi:hypothetical protein
MFAPASPTTANASASTPSLRGLGSARAQRRQRAIRVAGHVQFAVDHSKQRAIRIDHEGRSLARQRTHALHAKLPGDAAVWIGEQRKPEGVLFVEGLLPIHRIGADPRSLCTEFCELAGQVAEMAAFQGSARCHRLRIEEEHQRPVGQKASQGDRSTRLIDGREICDALVFPHDTSVRVELAG